MLPKIAAGAAIAAGSAALAGGALVYLFHFQGRMVQRAMDKSLRATALVADRTYRKKLGWELKLLLAGDSLAAGFGATDAEHTLGARLAKGVAQHTRRSVTLRTVAVVGDETSMLAAQLDRLPAGYVPDVAVLVVGSNDVARRVSTAESVAHLAGAVRRLRALGTEVVVGTCPDMGMAPAIPQPLRSVGGRASRRLAAAQAKAVVAAGGHPVATGHSLRMLFLAHPERMFSDDRFHPSSLGYRRSAKAMLPTVLAAVAARIPEFA